MQLKFLENYYQFPNEIKSYAYCQNVFRDMATEMQTRFSKGYQLLSALGKGNDFYEELSSLMDFLDEYCDEYSNKTTEVLNMMHRAGITNNVAYVTVFRNTSNIPIFNTYEDAMNYINSGVVSNLTSPGLCGGTYMKPKNNIPGVTADSSIVQIDWTADTYTVLSQIIKANPNIVVGEKQDSAGVLYIMLKAHQRG